MARQRYRMQNELEVKWVKAIGRRIRKFREAAGFSQKDFAQKIECPSPTLARAESGKHALPLFSFLRACQILGKDANYMLCRKRRKVENEKQNEKPQ